MPVTVVHHIPKLNKSGRKEAEHNHHGQTDIEAPEGAFKPRFDLRPLGVCLLYTSDAADEL